MADYLPTSTHDQRAGKNMTIEVMIAAANNVCTQLDVDHGTELADEFEKHKVFKHKNLKEKMCDLDTNLIAPIIARMST